MARKKVSVKTMNKGKGKEKEREPEVQHEDPLPGPNRWSTEAMSEAIANAEDLLAPTNEEQKIKAEWERYKVYAYHPKLSFVLFQK